MTRTVTWSRHAPVTSDGTQSLVSREPFPVERILIRDTWPSTSTSPRCPTSTALHELWCTHSGFVVDIRVMIVADSAVSEGTSAVSAIAGRQPSSASGIEDDAALTDVNALGASAEAGLVGRRVYIRNARINAVVAAGGFWVATKHEQLFVLPGDEVHLRQGQRVNIRGVVLELPVGMKNRLDDYIAARNETIYVYANQIRTL